MDLGKLVVAIGISIFLVMCIGEAVNLMYKSPMYDTGSLYSSNSDCYTTASDQCNSLVAGSVEQSQCLSSIYSSPAYTTCQDEQRQQSQNLQENYQQKIITYQYVSTTIYFMFGFLAIVLGFVFIRTKSIGAGLILGGAYIIIGGGFFSIISMFSSLSVGGLLGSTGAGDSMVGL